MLANPSPSASSPIPGVSALVRHRGKVLLVRRGQAPLKGVWALPGGRIEAGESAAAAIAREVMEETGIAIDRLQPIDAVTIATGDRRFAVTVFKARFVSGVLRAGDDADEARWVGVAELAGLPIAEQTLAILERHASETADD